MFYKPNLGETLARLRDFWTRRMTGEITAVARGFPNPCFQQFLDSQRLEPEGNEAADIPDDALRLAYWDAKLRIYGEVHDDSMPVAYPTLDFGESLITALVGGKIRLFWKGDGATYSALVAPVVSSDEDISRLGFDENSAIARQVAAVTSAMQKRARGLFGVCPFITMDALNFACEVMGTTRAYTAMANGGSREVHRLMDFAVDLNIRFLELQQRLIEDFAGGAFHWAAGWVPFTGATPWLSVDSYTCCSPRTYAESGLAYQRRLIDHFGQGVMHYHSSRLDLLLEVAKLKGLVGLSVDGSGRPQDPSPFSILLRHDPEIRKVAGDLPLMVACTKGELLEHMADRSLPGNVRYTVTDVETLAEANTLMDRVRNYRARV